jgi:hypothetical protein
VFPHVAGRRLLSTTLRRITKEHGGAYSLSAQLLDDDSEVSVLWSNVAILKAVSACIQFASAGSSRAAADVSELCFVVRIRSPSLPEGREACRV